MHTCKRWIVSVGNFFVQPLSTSMSWNCRWTFLIRGCLTTDYLFKSWRQLLINMPLVSLHVGMRYILCGLAWLTIPTLHSNIQSISKCFFHRSNKFKMSANQLVKNVDFSYESDNKLWAVDIFKWLTSHFIYIDLVLFFFSWFYGVENGNETASSITHIPLENESLFLFE